MKLKTRNAGERKAYRRDQTSGPVRSAALENPYCGGAAASRLPLRRHHKL